MSATKKSMKYEPVNFDLYKNSSDAKPQTVQERMQQRANEPFQTHFRTDRLFTVGHQWYFSTREGIDFGPYKDKKMAHKALDTFLRLVD